MSGAGRACAHIEHAAVVDARERIVCAHGDQLAANWIERETFGLGVARAAASGIVEQNAGELVGRTSDVVLPERREL